VDNFLVKIKITNKINKELWHIQKEDNRTPDKRNVVLMTKLKCLHWHFALTVALTTSITLSAQLADTIVVNWL
jgi:hypothetical protein